MSPPPAPDQNGAPRFPGPGFLDRALELVRFLRREDPWDGDQTAASLVPHLLEETHEVVDAIQAGDARALEGELGDLLLNLAFQIVVAEEGGLFSAESVYGTLEAKMVSRHPHIFGGGEKRSWEAIKAEERPEGTGVLGGLSKGLDPLTKAHRIQQKVAAVGFDWEDHRGALDKVREELAEVSEAIRSGESEAVEEEVGDLLFAVVNLARLAGTHATPALAAANAKFQARFTALEALARARGIDVGSAGLEVLDGLWDEIKRR